MQPEFIQIQQELESCWWRVPIALALVVAIPYFFHLALNDYDGKPEGRPWTPPPEDSPRDRSFAIRVHWILLAGFIACIAWNHWVGIPAEGALYYVQKVSAFYFLFYALVGIPAFISDTMEHRDHHAGLKRTKDMLRVQRLRNKNTFD